MKLKLCPEFGAINEFIESFISRYDTEKLKSVKIETLKCGVPEKYQNYPVSSSIISAYNGNGIYLGGGCNDKGVKSTKKTLYSVRLLVEIDRKCYPFKHADWYRELSKETKQGWITSSKEWTFDKPEQAMIWGIRKIFFCLSFRNKTNN